MKPSQLICRTLSLLFISLLSIPANASSTDVAGQTVPWWSSPGETDTTAFSALVLLFLLLFAVFHMYARFDRFAEKHNEGTPLQTTIPTLLMIAFAYEIFPPLSHFSTLLWSQFSKPQPIVESIWSCCHGFNSNCISTSRCINL